MGKKRRQEERAWAIMMMLRLVEFEPRAVAPLTLYAQALTESEGDPERRDDLIGRVECIVSDSPRSVQVLAERLGTAVAEWRAAAR